VYELLGRRELNHIKIRAIVVADDGDMDRGALDDPRLVGPREEDVARLLDTRQNLAVGAAADALRGQ
jgi:hypothetical protein